MENYQEEETAKFQEFTQWVTFEELQVEWCSNGLTVAGIPITRYTSGSFACDFIMREACSNTANLTVDPVFAMSCACVNEEKVLQARFAGINLPSQCFTTLCNIQDPKVYKLKSQQLCIADQLPGKKFLLTKLKLQPAKNIFLDGSFSHTSIFF